MVWEQNTQMTIEFVANPQVDSTSGKFTLLDLEQKLVLFFPSETKGDSWKEESPPTAQLTYAPQRLSYAYDP